MTQIFTYIPICIYCFKKFVLLINTKAHLEKHAQLFSTLEYGFYFIKFRSGYRPLLSSEQC